MVKDLCFEIIQKCPNVCVFCSSNACYERDTIIDFETFKRVIDYFMTQGGIEEISLSGGEPFLHPNLYDMILYCKTLGIRTVLFTSGVRRNIRLSEIEMNFLNKKVEEFYRSRGWPEEECQKAIHWEMGCYKRANEAEFNSIYREEMKYLKWVGLDKIVFDLQGSCANTYRCLMGKDHFDLAMTSIMRAHMAGLYTDVHFVPMRDNYREFPELLEMLDIVPVDNVSILNFVPQGRGNIYREKLMLSDQEMEEFRQIYLSTRDQFGIGIRIGIPLLGDDFHKCTAGLSKLVIRYDGMVLPCPAFKEFDIERLRRLGVPVWNIYTDLEQIKTYNATRSKPLCKKLYGMDRKIM